MRILFITAGLEGNKGGVYRYSEGLIKAVQDEGNVVLCAVSEISQKSDIEQQSALLPPLSYLANPFRAWNTARKVQMIIADFKPDVVHILVEPYAALIPFIKNCPPVVLTVHGTYAYIPHLLHTRLRRLLSAIVYHAAYQKCATIIAVSNNTAHWLKSNHEQHHVSLKNTVVVIPNGITPSTGEIQRTTPHVPLQLLFVGGLKPRKGVLEALDVVAQYRSTYGPCTFRIVGSTDQNSSYVARVRRKIDELHLNEVTKLEGEVTDSRLESYYRDADIFIMLAKAEGRDVEGFGIVYLEANMYGVPAIGAFGTGAEDAISDGISGWLIPIHDKEAAAKALHAIAAEWRSYSEGAQKWAKSHAWSNISTQYNLVYEELHRTQL